MPHLPIISQLTGLMLAKLLGREAAKAGLTKGSKGVSQICLVDEAIPVLIHDGECLQAQEQGRGTGKGGTVSLCEGFSTFLLLPSAWMGQEHF